MEYEWNDAKDAANRRKHGVPLSAVARFVPLGDELPHDGPDGDPWLRRIGVIDGKLYVLAYTFRGNRIRAISLRKVGRAEAKRHAR